MYIVRLVVKPRINNYRADFFPRKVRYKEDAIALQKEVETKGGKATVERVTKG